VAWFQTDETEQTIRARKIMAKKFTVLPNSPDPDAIETPDGLEAAGQTLWRQVMQEYDVSDIGGRQMLFEICAATDMVARLRKRIDADGEILKGKGGVREHPALKMELQFRSFVVRGLARLGLNFEPLRAHGGRPPGYA
jgi:hypothetical protein